MNGVDFTKQMSQTRENHNDTIRKNNAATEKRLTDANAQNELTHTKQLDGYMEDKSGLEKNHQKNLDHLHEKTGKALNENQDDFNRRVKTERDNFAKDAENKRKDFDKRFTDIKSGYRKSFGDEKVLNKDIQGNQKTSYEQNLSANKKDATRQLKTYQDDMSSSGEKLKEQYNNERQQLVNVQEDHVKGIHADSSKKYLELRDKVSNDMQSSRALAQSDAQTNRTQSDEELAKLQGKAQGSYNNLVYNNGKNNANLVETQQNENLKTNRANQENLFSVSRNFDDRIRDMENEKRRLNTVKAESAEVMNTQEGLNEKIENDNLVRNLRSKLVTAQSTYQDRATTEQTAFNDTLKQGNIDNASQTERKVNEANAAKLSRIADEREKNTKQLDSVMNQAREQRATNEQTIMNERKSAKERLATLKENFNKSMKTMEEKSKLKLEEVTNFANDDKSGFMKKVNEDRKQELFTMKHEFGKLMDSTIEDYEKRLNKYQKDNENLKYTMEQKLQHQSEKEEKNSQLMSKNYIDTRATESKNQALLMDQKLFEFKTDMAKTTNAFQTRLDQLQTTTDTKLKRTTSDYENKLKELRTSTSNELGKKEMDRQVDQSKLKQAFEAEKQEIVSVYENGITQMKTDHEDKMRKVQEHDASRDHFPIIIPVEGIEAAVQTIAKVLIR